MIDTAKNQDYFISALYHFVVLEDYEALRERLLAIMQQHNVCGTLLLAREGINGTIAGTREGVDSVLRFLKSDSRFVQLQHKESVASKLPFHRTKVKLKNEIITMGVPDIDAERYAGTYVKPSDWNDLISDPDVTVIDTRNEYEIGVGSFIGAINPHTDSFREFPAFAQTLNAGENKKVAMYCTGGIRCEKSTAYLKSIGFDDVYHLEGGILKYLEVVPEDESLWQGECFVFDDRVTVDHQMRQGRYDQCHACRGPISEKDKSSPRYVPGVSCPNCYQGLTEKQRARFTEREKQVRLAKKRGESHIGSDAADAHQQHKEEKLNHKARQREQSS
jgi:UPF0176 protein